MMRVAEFAVFGSLAAGLHIAAFAGWPGAPAGGAPAPPGLPAALAVQTADPALRALVEEWREPPDATVSPEAPARQAALPPAPGMPAIPDPAAIGANLPAQAERPRAARPLAETRALRDRPPHPPEPPRPAPRPAEATRPAQTASRGAAGAAPAPSAPVAAPRTDTAAQVRALGARVRAALAAALVYPQAAQARGTTGTPTLEITLSRAGRLETARIVRPSGSDLLDAAALRTAQRARYPAAPDDLPGRSFAFSVPLRFELR
jgi:TonB family protein